MKIDWFAILFAVVGTMNLLSGCYEWTWWWRLARGGYLPDQIGWEMTRLLYMLGGAGCLGAGIALFIQGLFSIRSIWFYIVGFALAAVLTVVLYNARENQSIVELINVIQNKNASRKSKD